MMQYLPLHQLLQLLDGQQSSLQPFGSQPCLRQRAVGRPGRPASRRKDHPGQARRLARPAALAASDRLELKRLRVAAGVHHAELASDGEVQTRCPGTEVGALPPFGQLRGLPVWVAERPAESTEIAFAAGAPTELICMAYRLST
jgi:hypothetical protein